MQRIFTWFLHRHRSSVLEISKKYEEHKENDLYPRSHVATVVYLWSLSVGWHKQSLFITFEENVLFSLQRHNFCVKFYKQTFCRKILTVFIFTFVPSFLVARREKLSLLPKEIMCRWRHLSGNLDSALKFTRGVCSILRCRIFEG